MPGLIDVTSVQNTREANKKKGGTDEQEILTLKMIGVPVLYVDKEKFWIVMDVPNNHVAKVA